MANQQAPADATLEQHQHEVCNAFARAAAAMRDAAHTAENFSNWFSRVNSIKNITVPPMFNGQHNFLQPFGGTPQQQLQPPPAPEQTGRKRKAAEDQDGKRKRQPKEKKVKDPNAPKRPPSAYLLYQNDIRKDVQAQHPDLPYSQILSEISKLWHDLDPETKQPYTKATATAKAKYEQEKAAYEDRNSTIEPVKPTVTKSKTPVSAPELGANKAGIVKPISTSNDSSDESTESSSSVVENNEEEEDEEEEEEEEEDDAEEVVPEPPRKKAKPTKMPTPPPPKAEKKKEKSGEGKKKKKTT